MRTLTVLLILSVFSCRETTPGEEEIFSLRRQADSMAVLSQNVLLQRVAHGIQKGGVEYAVEFCQVNAIPITDSLSTQGRMNIHRISDKNRNPNNNLKTETDRSVFDAFKNKSELADTFLIEKGQFVYYKRINLGMPTCLKCHGTPRTDIGTKTLQKIESLYPNDKAVGYKMNDFRGLWKIEIPN